MSHMTMGDEIHALRTDRAALIAERDALAAHVDRLREAAERGLLCANAINADHAKAISSTLAGIPETSFNQLKAQWQAEALESVIMGINDHKAMLDKIKHCQYIEALDDIRDDVQSVAESYRRQAEDQPFAAAREWAKSGEDDV